MGPEAVGTPRGDHMRVWAEALLDRSRTTPSEPTDSRPRERTLPGGMNRSTAPPPQAEPSVNDLMSTLIGNKLDELKTGIVGTIEQGQAEMMSEMRQQPTIVGEVRLTYNSRPQTCIYRIWHYRTDSQLERAPIHCSGEGI
jgi:hypothetical protein